MSARRDVLFALALWQTQGIFPTALLAASDDHGFALELLGTTLRNKAVLDWVLRQCVKKMPTGETYAALLMGAAQLLVMPKVAPYAAIAETVEAIKPAGKSAAAFVNAVLRNIQRNEPHLRQRLARQPEWVQSNIPPALWKRWVADYGIKTTRQLANALAATPALHLRLLPPHPAPTDLASHPEDAETFILPHGMRVEQVVGFKEGHFVVQDVATRHAITLMDVHPGMCVLDACAAPGGKTVQLAARLHGEGCVVACEKVESRLAKLEDTVRRCRLGQVVSIRQADLTQPFEGMFDRILIDAPCSNTGVFGKRPDARWNWSTKKTQELIATQRALLNQCAAHLLPGGRLVYSTCSIDPAENQAQIAAFLAEYPTFKLLEERLTLPSVQSDGAYAAALSPRD